MGTFLSVLLDTLAILAIIIFGSLLVVIVADLILCMFDGHQGIIVRRKKKDDCEEQKDVVKKDDIVVYSNKDNPNGKIDEDEVEEKEEIIDGNKVTDIDYDKAVEEQKMLNQKKGIKEEPKPEPKPAPKVEKKVEKAPANEDIFWDNEEDDEFNKILDEIIKEAKSSDGEGKEVKVQPKEDKKELDDATKKELDELRALKEQHQKELDEIKKMKEDFAKEKDEELAKLKNKENQEEIKEEPRKNELDEETKKELEELKALKEQHKKELEDFKQMKEDFAREKEEQLAMLKENLDKAKQDELEKIKRDTIKEQEKLEKMREDLEKEQDRFAKEQEEAKDNLEPIVKETIIKDEEEINKLKFKNLVRMNTRLARILRDTERLQNQKEKELQKREQERLKLEEKAREEKQREIERINEIQRQNQERLLKQQEELKRKQEITNKLNQASNRVSKYQLNTKTIRIPVVKPLEESVIEEKVITTTETIPHSDTAITTVEKTPMIASAKPLFDKDYYEQKVVELEEELREAEKELRINKSEYIPLTRIHKAYERDSEKLRKKEIQVAKQKVALYGVNSTKVDPEKKAKLDANLLALSELKDSVSHCEDVIKKNKDRYPVLEKNNRLITKQIDRINEDMKVCEKALAYYRKNK